MAEDQMTYDQTSQKLRSILADILHSDNVYYNSNESVRMSYPCIRFNLNGIRKDSADDGAYMKHRTYTIVLIHRDPDNLVVNDILDLPMCSFDRSYVADNLYHFVFTKYI